MPSLVITGPRGSLTRLDPVRAVRLWSLHSVAGSRRNAMVSSTVLAERRREREDVAAFLAAHTGGAVAHTA